jgi:hypothetical protein
LDEKEGEAKFKEKEDQKHAAGFSGEGARMEAGGGTHAGPKNGSVGCKFPFEGTKVAFGAAIADKVQFELVTAFEQLFEPVGLVLRVEMGKEGGLPVREGIHHF